MKNNFKFSIPILAALLFALAFAVGGCGGSGGGASSGTAIATDKSAGQAKLTIKWPVKPAGRLIPVASNSIVVNVSFNGAVVATQTAVNPGSGGTTTLSFPTLPVGQLGITATAYPSANGTGVAQASGTQTLAVTASKTATATVTMADTIKTLQIGSNFTNPLPISPLDGATQQLTVTALDAAGDNVLFSSANIVWVSSNKAVATVTQDTNDSGATLVGVSSGDATISVTELESGVTASLQVQVRGPLAQLQITAISPVLQMGAIMFFNVIAEDKAGNTITSPSTIQWQSSDTQVAVINASTGKCQAVPNALITAPQTVTITVTSGSLSSTATLTVVSATGAATYMGPLSLTLPLNDTQVFTVTTNKIAATSVRWSLLDPNNLGSALGSIDGNGVYTAPSSTPMFGGLPQQVTVQGVAPGGTVTGTVSFP